MKQKKVRSLPIRMRQKRTSSGRIYYYYDTCTKPRKWLTLGCDYFEALKKYADFEKEYNIEEMDTRINNVITFKYVANRYLKEVIPTKAVRTQRDNIKEIENLLIFFDNPPAPLNDILPIHIREYLDWRGQTAKTRANRERALFSHIFNKAREWGYTDKENPCRGIKGFKETGRDVYISDELFWNVYNHAERPIQYIMLIAYLTGQRVADLLKIKINDINGDELWIKQNKTGTRIRIKLIGSLREVIDNIIHERNHPIHDYLFTKNNQPLNYQMLRHGMNIARKSAGVEKNQFQFRDLRAKAATDKDETMGLEAAQILLGHKKSTMTDHYIRHRKGKLTEPTQLKIDIKKKEV